MIILTLDDTGAAKESNAGEQSPRVESPSSPQLPPTPLSSCGSRSPPPGAKTPEECRLSSSSPSSAPVPRILPFSIDNILRPDFGARTSPSKQLDLRKSPELILRTPPKTPESCRTETPGPVDLSQRSSGLTASSPPASADSPAGQRQRRPENIEDLVNPKIPAKDMIWPAWVYCTRYSDRPSSGPRSRKLKCRSSRGGDEKRPRTAFTSEQLARLKREFEDNRYLTERRRQDLAKELGLNESQIKIWFQNKRAKMKKSTSQRNSLAQHLMAQGLYNHSTIPIDEDDPMFS